MALDAAIKFGHITRGIHTMGTKHRNWYPSFKDVLYIIGPFIYEYLNIDRHMTIIVEGVLLLAVMDAPQGSKATDYYKDSIITDSKFFSSNIIFSIRVNLFFGFLYWQYIKIRIHIPLM